MTNTAAHIITTDAVALGEPEILIFEHDEAGAGRLIERHPLVENVVNGVDVALALSPAGWKVPTHLGWTLVEHGYWVVDVERI